MWSDWFGKHLAMLDLTQPWAFWWHPLLASVIDELTFLFFGWVGLVVGLTASPWLSKAIEPTEALACPLPAPESSDLRQPLTRGSPGPAKDAL